MERDIAEDTFISKWPEWLRWILVIPAAIIAPVLATVLYMLLLFISDYFGDARIWEFFTQMVSSAILGGLFVYGGAWTAPKSQFVVSIILLILLTVMTTLMFLVSFNIDTDIGPLNLGFHSIIMLLAGGYAVYFVKEGDL